MPGVFQTLGNVVRVLVIDPLSSGPELVSHLEKQGHDVLSYFQDEPAAAAEAWTETVVETALQGLALTSGFDHIIAGSDYGVVAAEVLAARAGLPCNDPELIWARRDKDAMVLACGQAGLRVPQSWRITSVDQIEAIRPEVARLANGVVVKPASSAGSDSCIICHSEEEIREVVSGLLGKVNLLGVRNTSCIVQERIVGEQYFVNTVTTDAEHLVTEFFVYGLLEQDGRPHIYNAITLPESGELFETARDFAFAVNDALGVRFGASHTEMRLTPEGWVLIEYNGRSMGPVVPDEVYLPARGFSQISLWADCIAGGVRKAAAVKDRGQAEHCVAWHMPQPTHSGVLVSTHWELLEQLPSFSLVARQPAPGEIVDLYNRVTTASHGLVFFSGPSTEEVVQDLQQARLMELDGALFTMAPATPAHV
ncbi:ATP-grasp domain-containing protein [Arthrobacter sp. RCC_34]|uniref:ATP-grasp domain-containing protein n=1 Tax=Arthrobacter sp. RCC_34 TaxID=3239230 RepID=UPI0035240EC6